MAYTVWGFLKLELLLKLAITDQQRLGGNSKTKQKKV